MHYRYFFSGDVYKTYKQTYSGYKEISQACFNSLSSSQFPASINPRPGARVMKYVSTDDLYVGVPGGIQKITADAARVLYGSDYASNILSISVVEWPALSQNVRAGTITTATVHPGMVFRVSSKPTSLWYMAYDNKIHEVASSAVDANYFNGAVSKNGKVVRTAIYTVPDSAISGIPTGDMISTPVAYLTDRTYAGYDANGNWTAPVPSTSTPNTPVTSGAVSVSLSSANPSGQTLVPTGSNTLVKLADLNFTAGSTDSVVTGLNLMRTGLTVDQDINNVYLMDGNNVIATNLGITNGKINFSNGSGLFTVPANGTKKITVGATLNTSAATRSIGVSLVSAADVITSGNGSVSGTFPVASNVYQGTNLSSNAGGIQITNVSSGQTSPGISVNAGQTSVLVGQLVVQGQNQTTRIDSIKFTNTGSASKDEVTNFKLMNGNGQQVGSTVASLNGNVVLFDLTNNPLQLSPGTSVTLNVYADIVGGSFRNFQLNVLRNYDIVGEDLNFNFPLLPTLNTGNFPIKLSYVTINQGTLTLNRASTSPSVNVLPGGTNQDIAVIDAVANGENVKITALNITLNGTMYSNMITNLKLIDNQGQQIGATQSTISGSSVPLSTLGTAATFTGLNYYLSANQHRQLRVVADVASSATGTIQASLASVAGEGQASYQTFSGLGVSGNTLTANTTILSIVRNNAMPSPSNVVAGRQGVRVGSFLLQAGSVSDIQISNLSVKTQTNAQIPTTFQNLRLVYGGNSSMICQSGNGTQVGTTQPTIDSNTSYNFTFGPTITVTKGSSLAVDVCADVKTGGSFATSSVVQIASGAVSGIVVTTNQAVSSIPAVAVDGQSVVTVGSGTLSYGLSGSNPVAAQIGMGTQNVKLASYRLQGSPNESINITSMGLAVTSSLVEAFTNYRLMVGNTLYGSGVISGTAAPSFVVNFSGVRDNNGVALQIPTNGNVTIDVLADANTWSNIQPTGFETATQNVTTTVLLASTTYQGADSNSVSTATSANSGNTFNLLRTTLNAGYANSYAGSIVGGISTRALVGAVTFTPGTDYAYLASTTFTPVYSGATTTNGGVTTYSLETTDGQVLSTTTVSNGSGNAGIFTLNQNSAATGGPGNGPGLTLTASTPRTLLIYADLTGGGFAPVVSGSKINFSVQINNWTWSDGTRLGLTADTAISRPITVSPSLQF
jgi:hypothetical protein